jgi:hypothetical protein
MKTSINNLILIALYLLEEPSSFEKITVKCFQLFPEQFSLPGYSHWPDSRQLDRPLRRLVADKLLKKQKDVFSLTSRGKDLAQQANTLLRQGQLLS